MPSRKLCIIGCAAIAVALMSFVAPMAAQAAIITWGDTLSVSTGSNDSGDDDVLKTGDTFSVDGGTTTLTAGDGILAWNAEGPTNTTFDPLIDGVQFTDTDIWGSLNETRSISQVLAGGTTTDYDYDRLIGTMDRSNTSNPETITLTGLTADTDYVVQVWYNDASNSTREMEFAGTNPLTLKADAWEYGNGIFTADGATQALSVEVTVNIGVPHIAAVQVREVIPEPATMSMLLMAIGGLAMFLRRRR